VTAPWTTGDIPSQNDRVAVITGSNSGLGFQVAVALARAGARVVLACRNTEKAAVAATAIRGHAPEADVAQVPLDLADLASVAAAATLIASYGQLDLLINNAGLMAVDASQTRDGFETQFGVNHLGHFALTAQLLPALLATPGSRVVTVSSMGHRAGRMRMDDLMFNRRGYRRWQAYTQSKLANLLFTTELHRRLAITGADTAAVAAHPGASRTDLGTEGGHFSNRLVTRLVPLVTQSAVAGALPILRAACDLGVRSGEFYGPRFLAMGHPVRETPSRHATDSATAGALWVESARLTGVSPTFPTRT
jgi:protochlorophyllide reductase